MNMFIAQRIYDESPSRPGRRFLVERLWPRGVKKEDLKLDVWLKEVAPSTELRQWFNHDPVKWTDFCRRYSAELDRTPETWQPLVEAARTGDVILLYSAHDTEHNNAVALKQYLETRTAGRHPTAGLPGAERGTAAPATSRRH
jgi:uncharacterized protein YeaO (DUF488 family)